MVKSRFGGADGDVECVGDLGERQVLVVVQDDGGPVLRREAREGTLQAIPVGQLGAGVRDVAVVLGQ